MKFRKNKKVATYYVVFCYLYLVTHVCSDGDHVSDTNQQHYYGLSPSNVLIVTFVFP